MKAILAALAALATASDNGPPFHIAGAWTLQDTLPRFGTTFPVTCDFRQDGAAIAGTCADPASTFPVSGSVLGGKLTLDYRNAFAGVPAHFVYTADIQPDGGLKGTFTIGEVQGVFTASRR